MNFNKKTENDDKKFAARVFEAHGWTEPADQLRSEIDDEESETDFDFSIDPARDFDGDEEFDLDHALSQYKYHTEHGDPEVAEMWVEEINEAGYNFGDKGLEMGVSFQGDIDDLKQIHEFFDRRGGYDKQVEMLEKIIDAHDE